MNVPDARKSLCLIGLALCAFLTAPAARANEEPPPPSSPCVDISLECVDAPAYGAPIQLYGVVTNCSASVSEWVKVRNADTNVEYLPWVLLGPGQSADWSGDYVPVPYDCPVLARVRATAYVLDWSVKVEDWTTNTCDCPTLTEICRTPGFWGQHAGTEKKDSQNITQQVIDAAPAGLMVCGETVDNTAVDSFASALEAMCLSVRGEQVLQLANHLTAAALNCVMSGSAMDCDGTRIADLFAHCNDVCAVGTDPDEIGYCAAAIDCWNNGGTLLESGMCQLGTCAGDESPCEESEDCGYDLAGAEIVCVPFTDTCHYELLINEARGLNFEPPGPAGSPKACLEAIKNDCSLFEGCGD